MLNKLSKATHLFGPNQHGPGSYPLPHPIYYLGGRRQSKWPTASSMDKPVSEEVPKKGPWVFEAQTLDEEGERIYTVSTTLSSGVPVVCKNIRGLLMMDTLGNCPLFHLQGFRIRHYSLNTSNKYLVSTAHVPSTLLIVGKQQWMGQKQAPPKRTFALFNTHNCPVLYLCFADQHSEAQRAEVTFHLAGKGWSRICTVDRQTPEHMHFALCHTFRMAVGWRKGEQNLR